MEYYCAICEVAYDGRNDEAAGNHQLCYENARMPQSDPDAVVGEEDNDNDSDERRASARRGKRRRRGER